MSPASFIVPFGVSCVIPKLRSIIDRVLNDALKNGLGYTGSLTNFVEDVTGGGVIVLDRRALV